MDPQTPIAPGTQPAPQATPLGNKSSGLLNPSKLYQSGGNENLVNPMIITAGEKGFWKSVLLDVLTVLFAAAFAYTLAQYLGGAVSFWVMLPPLFLWAAVSVLEGFLEKKFSRRFCIVLLETCVLIGFFHDYAWQALAISGGAALLFLSWGYLSMRREVQNAIELRFFTASGKAVGKVITAALIVMVVMYASLTSGQGNFFVSKNGFDGFFNWASGFANHLYPTVPLNGSFGDFAQAVARMQLAGNPAFQSLPPDEQNATVADSATQIMGVFSPAPSSTAASSSAATEPTSDVFYNYFANLSSGLQDRFQNLFIEIWALLLFVILRSIGIVVGWIAQFISLLFYELLLVTGFMKIDEETATKEIIGY